MTHEEEEYADNNADNSFIINVLEKNRKITEAGHKTHAMTNHKHKRVEKRQEQITSVKRQREKYYNC
jgi:hypothetical protein